MANLVADLYRCYSGGIISGGTYSGYTPPTRYKYQSPTLFYSPPLTSVLEGNLSSTPSRGSVADPKESYVWAGAGPSRTAVENYSQWYWLNLGGDWLDTTGTPQGTAACWSFAANAVTTGNHVYTVDMTSALQQVVSSGKWNAWIVRCSQNRSFASRHSANPPYVDVVYTDTTTERLPCTASAWLPSGTAYTYGSNLSVGTWGTNAALEFKKPAKAVTSAVMTITIDVHSATAATISGFLANPPMNNMTVTSGLAINYQNDIGILTDPNVFFSHRYEDGTTLTDFIALSNQSNNIGYISNWSPHMFGLGAADTNKLPYKFSGVDITNKFVQGASVSIPVSIVPSTYTGEGFTPPAPGQGALRVVIPGNHAADGSNVGSGGGLGADLWTYLPEADCGLLDDIYVRYQVMYAPYPRQKLEQTKMFRSTPGGTAVYIAPQGKTGPGPHAWSAFGGNNRTGGGNTGWSSRGVFSASMDMDPDTIRFGWHCLDMFQYVLGQGHDTQGYQLYAGQQGPQGVRLKRGVWYTIETRLKLNTWNETWDTNPSNDGIFQMWIDGVLVIDYNNFSFRQGPLNYTDPTVADNPAAVAVKHDYTPTTGSYHPPFRQLGHVGVWLNEYQGGIISTEFDQTVFYSNIVAAKSRIGGVQTVSAPAPNIIGVTWTPDRDSNGDVYLSNWTGLPLNTWIEVSGLTLNPVIQTPHYLNQGGSDSSNGIINAWGGMGWDYQNNVGYLYGGGHSDASACETGIYKIDVSKLTFTRVRDRDPMSVVQGWDATNNVLLPNVESWTAGFNVPLQNSWPASIHSYHSLVWIPPSWMGNTSGGMLIMGNAKTIYNLDTGTWTTTHFVSPSVQVFDISNMGAYMDGNAFYGPRSGWYHWKYDTTINEASDWSADSYGKFSINFANQNKATYVGESVWGTMRERREEFSLNSGAFTRTRYGQAIDANATNWNTYSDTITLTSLDDSHLDFSFANLIDYSRSGSTATHYFTAAGADYDHSTSTIYVQRNEAGGQLYKITGIAGNTWTTEKIAGTGATRSSGAASSLATYGRFRLFDMSGHKFALRISNKDHPVQVMRIS